MKYAN